MVNIEIDSEKIKELYERIDDLIEENKRLKATIKAYAKQVNRLEESNKIMWRFIDLQQENSDLSKSLNCQR